ncbi:MAG TPA: hypothetical protein ENH82_15030 [bacterium]|nr:hypothetical protein [bacterium]
MSPSKTIIFITVLLSRDFKSTLLMTLLILLGGCQSTSNTQSTSKPLPSIITAPPQDNAQYLFGVGQGLDLERAQTAALAEIARKLMVSVSSRTDIDIFNDGKNNRDSFRQQLSTEVGDTNLSNYTVLENHTYNGKIFTLIQIPRESLVRNVGHQWQQSHEMVEVQAKRFRTYSNFQRIIASRKTEEILAQAERRMWLYLSVKSDFNYQPNNAKYTQLRAAIAKAKDDFQIRIHSDQNSKYVAGVLASLLSEKGFNASLSSNTKGVAAVNVSSQTKRRKIDGEYIEQLSLLLKVSDERGRILGTKKYNY